MHDLGNYCKITREVLGNYIAVVQGEVLGNYRVVVHGVREQKEKERDEICV